MHLLFIGAFNNSDKHAVLFYYNTVLSLSFNSSFYVLVLSMLVQNLKVFICFTSLLLWHIVVVNNM